MCFWVNKMSVSENDLHNLRMWISERSGVGGWKLNLDMQELICTDQTRAIHGVDKDYVPNVDEALLFYPEDVRPAVTKAIENALVDGKAWELEVPFIKTCGRKIWVRARGEAIFERERPICLMGTFQDITDIVKRREELEHRPFNLQHIRQP